MVYQFLTVKVLKNGVVEFMIIVLKKLVNRIPKDFMKVFTFDIVTKIFSAIISILIINILNTNDYAVYTKFSSIASFILGVIGTGLSFSFVRIATEDVSRGKDTAFSLYKVCIMLTIIAFMIVFLFKRAIKSLYSMGGLATLLSILYGGALSLNRMNQSYFQAKEKYTMSGVIDNIRNIVLCLALIATFLFRGNVPINVLLYITVICMLVAYFIGYFVIRKENNNNFICKIKSNVIKDMALESGWLILYSAILNMFNQSSLILLSYMSGDISVAEYGVAFKYYTLMLTLLTSIKTVIRVRMSKIDMVDNIEKRINFSYKWIRYTWKPTIIITLVAIIGFGFIFPIINGSEYNNSIAIFRILSIGVCISYLFSTNVANMTSEKRYKELCAICAISLSINIIINYFFIPILGANATAIGTVLANAILNISCFLISIHFFDRLKCQWTKN